MLNQLSQFFDTLNGWVWSSPLVYLCLGSGIYFSIRMKFPQVRLFKEMIRLLFGGRFSKDGVTAFQAFSIAVGGRVGVGNIAGVATAIYMGGPGAVFWIWAIAFLGASTAFIKSSLAQAYKVEENGNYVGGAAYFINKGLRCKPYAALFAVVTILAPGVFMPGAQTWNIVESIRNASGISPFISGVVVCALLGLIIFGGIKRIASAAEIMAPFMSVAYVLMAMIIIIVNITKLPGIIWLIFSSAFGLQSALSGVVGSAIAWGVKRGVYSNEAGQGSGAIIGAAAECSHPAKQGLVQAFSVYIDTLLICSMTAFMVLITGSYNVVGAGGKMLVDNLPGVQYGVLYTQRAVDTVIPGWGGLFIAASIFLFAFTSLMAYYYEAESNVTYLFPKSKNALTAFRALFLLSTYSGVVNSGAMIWTVADLGVGMMAWLNIIAILILQNQGLKLLKDYEIQKAKGIDPIFVPSIIGLESDVWSKKAALSYNC